MGPSFPSDENGPVRCSLELCSLRSCPKSAKRRRHFTRETSWRDRIGTKFGRDRLVRGGQSRQVRHQLVDPPFSVYGASWRLELITASLIIYPTICWCSVNHKSVVFLLLCLSVFPPESAPLPPRPKIFTFRQSFGSLHPATHPLFRPLVGFSPRRKCKYFNVAFKSQRLQPHTHILSISVRVCTALFPNTQM